MFNKIKDYYCHAKMVTSVFSNQYMSDVDIDKLQGKLVSNLIKHAVNHVEFYRELYKSFNINPNDIKSVTDISKLPIITKNDIRCNHDKILSDISNPSKYNKTFTSGSSGIKLEVVVDKEVSALYRLTQLRQFLGLGYSVFDKMAYMRPAPPAGVFPFQRFGVFRRYHVSSLDPPAVQLAALDNIKPQILYAYPSTLYLLALEAKKRGKVNIFDLKFIISNSELLTPEIREFVQNVFSCKVFDEYSCLEFLGIGFECHCQKMHVVSDNVIVEVVDDDGNILAPNENGRLIITSLNNRAMPYIRYEIGDIGSLSDTKCECGRSFPLFGELSGRNDDLLLKTDGSFVPPRNLCLMLRKIPGVYEFQVIQQSLSQININIVILPEYIEKNNIVTEVIAAFRKLFGPDPVINVEIVPSIERGRTGKLRAVKSMIK
jgi:phenylacetate-CoA ligase